MNRWSTWIEEPQTLTSVSEAKRDSAKEVVIIGAGPAGLTAAYWLATRHAIKSTVLEADEMVGGISRTVERNGWRFDIGGHRFFTKVKEVEELWGEILPDDEFMLRPRLSRIYYEGKYYDYPLKAANALRNLGLGETLLCLLSYLWVRVRPPKNQDTLEGWIAARFGWRLYSHFFKSYNEKLWGVPVRNLPADFAAQRIKNLSLFKAAVNAILPKRKQTAITSLIEEFRYPKYGPGMMWERCAELVRARGCAVKLREPVRSIRHQAGRAIAVISEGPDGTRTEHPCTEVISSMPLAELVAALDPPPSDDVVSAGADLRYRDFLTVALVVPAAASFPDNWIYIHSPNVQVGRIQNFGAWSPFMVKDGKTCLGLEYFVFEGDETWTRSDSELIAQGKRELAILGLVDPEDIEDGYVVRMPKAYPFYDERYKENVATIVEWLNAHATNVHAVGRNGMHRYNNQDHSMYTAMLTAENIANGAKNDVWSVNVEDEYHEEKSAADYRHRFEPRGTGRDAPLIPRPLYGPGHPVNREMSRVSVAPSTETD